MPSPGLLPPRLLPLRLRFTLHLPLRPIRSLPRHTVPRLLLTPCRPLRSPRRPTRSLKPLPLPLARPVLLLLPLRSPPTAELPPRLLPNSVELRLSLLHPPLRTRLRPLNSRRLLLPLTLRKLPPIRNNKVLLPTRNRAKLPRPVLLPTRLKLPPTLSNKALPPTRNLALLCTPNPALRLTLDPALLSLLTRNRARLLPPVLLLTRNRPAPLPTLRKPPHTLSNKALLPTRNPARLPLLVLSPTRLKPPLTLNNRVLLLIRNPALQPTRNPAPPLTLDLAKLLLRAPLPIRNLRALPPTRPKPQLTLNNRVLPLTRNLAPLLTLNPAKLLRKAPPPTRNRRAPLPTRPTPLPIRNRPKLLPTLNRFNKLNRVLPPTASESDRPMPVLARTRRRSPDTALVYRHNKAPLLTLRQSLLPPPVTVQAFSKLNNPLLLIARVSDKLKPVPMPTRLRLLLLHLPLHTLLRPLAPPLLLLLESQRPGLELEPNVSPKVPRAEL